MILSEKLEYMKNLLKTKSLRFENISSSSQKMLSATLPLRSHEFLPNFFKALRQHSAWTSICSCLFPWNWRSENQSQVPRHYYPVQPKENGWCGGCLMSRTPGDWRPQVCLPFGVDTSCAWSSRGGDQLRLGQIRVRACIQEQPILIRVFSWKKSSILV